MVKIEQMTTPEVTIAVVGAGFSGLMTAHQLASHARCKAKIYLLEANSPHGFGPAYRTPYAAHLLNVPAGKMSALPDDAEHFTKWLASEGIPASPYLFARRADYSRYLDSFLAALIKDRERFCFIHGAARAIRKATDESSRYAISLEDGSQLHANTVILAFGHESPRRIGVLNTCELTERRLVIDGWDYGAFQLIEKAEDVLLVGSGLTMLDAVLTLSSRGHRGKLTAVSRRGLLPLPHLTTVPSPALVPFERRVRYSCRALLKEVRSKIAADPNHWQCVVDSLRPITASIWHEMSLAQRKSFLTHLAPYWDTHRHRCAPQIAATIAAMRDSGQLTVRAGRIAAAALSGEKVQVTVAKRSASQEKVALSFDRVINCLGPETDYRRTTSPLLRQILEDGLVKQDSLALGLVSDDDGRAIGSSGGSSSLFLIGPARKATLWESIAVPELRLQSKQLAEVILTSSC